MKPLKSIFTEERMTFLIRWWAVGAVYFFIGWGTNISMASAIDFVFFLGLSIGVFNMLVVNPIVRHMYGAKSDLRYRDTTLIYKVRYRLIEILIAMLVVVVLLFIYNLINTLAIQLILGQSEQVFLPGEPISFGLMYMAVYSLMTGFTNNIANKIKQEKKVGIL